MPSLLVSLFKKFDEFIRGILFRIKRKNRDDERGELFGGAKRTRMIFGATIVVLAASFALVMVTKEGQIISPEQALTREAAPGAKVKTNFPSSINQKGIFDSGGGATGGDSVNCDGILINLKLRGSLRERERIMYEKYCRNELDQDTVALIDSLLKADLPPTAVSDILKNTDKSNIKNITRALQDEKVVESLRSEVGDLVAQNIDTISKLNEEQRSTALDILKTTPPQFQKDVIKVLGEIAEIDDDDAKASLLRTLSLARDKASLGRLEKYSHQLRQASPDEQKVLAESYEKAKTKASQQSMLRAVTEIVQLDPDDPVRKKLVESVQLASDLAPEQMEKALNSIANLAQRYRTETDPELKRMLQQAIVDASSLDELAALSDRLNKLDELETAGIFIPKDKKIALLKGDTVAIKSIEGAHQLLKLGDPENAKKMALGQLDDQDFQRILAKLKKGSQTPTGEFAPATGQDRDSILSELVEVEQNKARIEAKIRELLAAGVDPSSSELVELYKNLSDLNERQRRLKSRLAEVDVLVSKRLAELMNKYKKDFSKYGIEIPSVGIELPKTSSSDEPVRLGDIEEYDEFWVGQKGGDKDLTQNYFRFKNKNQEKNGTLLGDVLGKRKSWVVGGNTTAVAGANGDANSFEMSRLLKIPGVIRGVPLEGIPSSKVSEYQLQFEFLTSVANRLTGLIEIPRGSRAICKPKSFDNDTGRLFGDCSLVDTGARKDLSVNFTLCDANGVDGVMGRIEDNRGWYLAGVFLTAFMAGAIDAFTAVTIEPAQAAAKKAAEDYVTISTGQGVSDVMNDVGRAQVNQWQNGTTFWRAPEDALLACVRQK